MLFHLQVQGSNAMVAVQQGGGGSHSQEGWLGAGLASGHAAVMDTRCGELCAFWHAHEAGLSALACSGDHMLLTGSQVPAHAPLTSLFSRMYLIDVWMGKLL